jgi:apolipoprotein N-acyltransferase
MQAVDAIRRRPASRWGWTGHLALPGLVLFLVCWWGGSRSLSKSLPSGSIKVALVQPAIPQTLIWDASADEERFQKLLSLTREALEENPHLLVWPEAAFPSYLRYDLERFRAITNLIVPKKVWMILGADDAEPNLATPDPEDFHFYNACFLLSPAGEIKSVYRKRRLVVFGEYIPLKKWLPFLGFFTPVERGFASGRAPAAFELDDWKATTAPLICFEDVFANLARDSVQRDTDFLINLTNNGWFGESSAQWQHAVNASFRAIECGVPLVRCTNNGLTCWIDSHGRIHDPYFEGHGNVYQEGVKFSEIPLYSPSDRRPTIYLRYGDWFGWTCAGFSFSFLLFRSMRNKTNSEKRIGQEQS